MGTWGTGIFDNDTAADVRADYQALIAQGYTPESALERLLSDYQNLLNDPDEATVFWVAPAATQLESGHLQPVVQAAALAALDAATAFAAWADAAPEDFEDRHAALASLREALASSTPPGSLLD